AVQVDGAGQQVRTGVAVVDGLVAREGERQADHGAAGEGLIPESQPGGERNGVASQLVADAVDGDGVKRGTGGEVVDIRQLSNAGREDEVVAGLRGDVGGPVSGGGPVVVGAAAVPGGHGRSEA